MNVEMHAWKTMHQKITDKQPSAFEQIPSEIIELIFHHVLFKDLKSLALVSKGFHDIVHKIWTVMASHLKCMQGSNPNYEQMRLKFNCIHRLYKNNYTNLSATFLFDSKVIVFLKTVDKTYRTPLSKIFTTNLLDSRRSLIDKTMLICFGANPNVLWNPELSTGSQVCDWYNTSEQFNFLSFLIDHNLDLNHQDENGDTILHWAVKRNQTKMIKSLLKRGVNSNIRNRQNKKAIDLISSKADEAVIKAKFKKFMNLDVSDKNDNIQYFPHDNSG